MNVGILDENKAKLQLFLGFFEIIVRKEVNVGKTLSQQIHRTRASKSASLFLNINYLCDIVN